VADEEDVKKKKKSEDEDEDEKPKKKKKKSSDDDDDDKPKKKKKVKKDDDEEEDKPKKKKKKDDDDDDDKPKKKKSKSGNPFREGSVIAEAFDLCVAGTTRKKLNRFAEEKEVGVTRIFSCMKAGEYGGVKWKYTETDDGDISIKLKKGE